MAESNAGRDLDVMVAEKVMGIVPRHIRVCGEIGQPLVTVWSDSEQWDNADGRFDRIHLETFGLPPRYSTDIAAAWLVVERLRANGFNVSVSVDAATDVKYNYACEVARRQWRGSEYEEGATPAHAICLAALAAIGSGGVPAGDASDPEER